MGSQPKIFAISDGRAGIERQAQALAGAIANQIGAIVETKRLNPKAVSYTHLDVYKRQILKKQAYTRAIVHAHCRHIL